MVIGYGIATIVRPFTAAAHTAPRFWLSADGPHREGHSHSPRDALLADSLSSRAWRAFGFHAAADNAGGCSVRCGFMILKLHGVGSFDGTKHLLPHDEQALRNVFWLAAVPLYRDGDPDRRRPRRSAIRTLETSGGHFDRRYRGGLTKRFWHTSCRSALTLGNSTERFCFAGQQLGVPVAMAPILWALLNFVKSATGNTGPALRYDCPQALIVAVGCSMPRSISHSSGRRRRGRRGRSSRCTAFSTG